MGIGWGATVCALAEAGAIGASETETATMDTANAPINIIRLVMDRTPFQGKASHGI